MQINQRVHAIRTPYYMTLPSGIPVERFVYSFLIYGSQICLIDTGISGSEEIIFDYIRKTDRRIEDISLIIQTHSHPDHIGSTRTIKAETGSSVAIHSAEKAWIENVQLQAGERPVPGFESLVSGSVAVNRVIEDKEIIELGCGLKLQVIHTPGHSPGSISILLLGFNVLFSGDAVPVPGEMPIYDDVMESIESLGKLKALNDIHHFLPACDEPAKGMGACGQKLDEGLNYLQRIHEAVIRDGKESASLQNSNEFCGRVFSIIGIPPVLANPLAAKSLSSHLPHLNKNRLI